MAKQKFVIAISCSKKCVEALKSLDINPDWFINEVMRELITKLEPIKGVGPDGCFYVENNGQNLLLLDHEANSNTFLNLLNSNVDSNIVLVVKRDQSDKMEEIKTIIAKRDIIFIKSEISQLENILDFTNFISLRTAPENAKSLKDSLRDVLTKIAIEQIDDIIKALSDLINRL